MNGPILLVLCMSFFGLVTSEEQCLCGIDNNGELCSGQSRVVIRKLQAGECARILQTNTEDNWTTVTLGDEIYLLRENSHVIRSTCYRNSLSEAGHQLRPGDQRSSWEPCTDSCIGNHMRERRSHAYWEEWGAWGACSVSCGDGNKIRRRSCLTTKRSAHTCSGPQSEMVPCNQANCTVVVQWGQWNTWNPCIATCGPGLRFRQRSCSGGSTCPGLYEEFGECNNTHCQGADIWTVWGSWGQCNASCDTGSRLRTRSCVNPDTGSPGTSCTGSVEDNEQCNTQPCPVTTGHLATGQWGDWSPWFNCTVTCGDGVTFRIRVCQDLDPHTGGNLCDGQKQEFNVCQRDFCPVDGGWNVWSVWSECTRSCGHGIKLRTRTCDNPPPRNNGSTCVGPPADDSVCNTQSCTGADIWTVWGSWGQCNASCDTGSRLRTRSCLNPDTLAPGTSCTGSVEDNEQCNTQPCPVHGAWSDWQAWGNCNTFDIVTCVGFQTRHRTCSNPAPAHSGNDCVGTNTTQTNVCTPNCTVDGGWGSWGPWGSCKGTCGGLGTQERHRLCDNPTPKHGGICHGVASENNSCNTEPCKVDGGWSDWSTWTSCSMTCGAGSRIRTRLCSNPSPSQGGLFCLGNPYMTEYCTEATCTGVYQTTPPTTPTSKVFTLPATTTTNNKTPPVTQATQTVTQTTQTTTQPTTAKTTPTNTHMKTTPTTTHMKTTPTTTHMKTTPTTTHMKTTPTTTHMKTTPTTTHMKTTPTTTHMKTTPTTTHMKTTPTTTHMKTTPTSTKTPTTAETPTTTQTTQTTTQSTTAKTTPTTTNMKTTPTSTKTPTTTPTKAATKATQTSTTMETSTTTQTLPTTRKTPTTTKTAQTTTNIPSTTSKTTPTTQTKTSTTPTATGGFDCYTCDGPPDVCEFAYTVSQCPHPYCVNDVTNNKDGSTSIDRRCGTQRECIDEWYQTYSDDDKCSLYDVTQTLYRQFRCSFCCVTELCNLDVKPELSTLFSGH